jgi:multisubunit Na+/H+ antiporter MnhG subunit
MEIKKIFVVEIILLFIGIAVAPSINQSIAKASYNDDLVEVMIQACGIKGYGDTTV